MPNLGDRLDQLGISIEECSALVYRSPAEVEEWMQAKTLPDEAAVLLRFLSADADALRRVNHLRRTFQGDLRGAGINYAGIEGVPYGTSDVGKVTGGVPS